MSEISIAGTHTTSGDDLTIHADPVESALFGARPLRDLRGSAVSSSIDGVAMSSFQPKSGRSHLMYVSENLAALLGYRPDQLLGKAPKTLLADDTPQAQLDAVEELVNRGEQATVNLELAHCDGSKVPVKASFLTIPALDGTTPIFLALYRDLSPRPSAEKVLADHADMLDSLARGYDLSAVLADIARRAERQIHGGTCWIGLADRDLELEGIIHGGLRPGLMESVFGILDGDGIASLSGVVRIEDLPLEVSLELSEAGFISMWLTPMLGPDRRHLGSVVLLHGERLTPHPSETQVLSHLGRVAAVATERSSTEATLTHHALHDPLTQLPNRALIVDRMEQAVSRLKRDSSKLSVLLVDIDRFKNINDTRGSEVGDEVLREVSRRLRGSIRHGDTVGRVASDQFLALCTVQRETEVVRTASRIVSLLSEPVEISHLNIDPEKSEPVPISASVGIVILDEPPIAPGAVISNAESALKLAVEAGRGRYAMYSESLQQRIVVRHEIERALKIALANNQFVLHYQPLVETRSGQMIGAEALLRWERPEYGLLPPGEFIEIAEESGLIVQIGDWVIDEVCRHISQWPANDHHTGPVISVNLSAAQLADDSLLPTVLAAIERHGTDVEKLGFEVTESMRVEDLEKAIAALKRLSALGCKVAIDDFGIGHATLDYLRRFSMADTIKIDGPSSMVLVRRDEDTAIVTASLALASSLGMQTVAEGVETWEQFTLLRDLKCEIAQGFVLSRPVPMAEALDLWHKGRLVPEELIRT